MIAPDELETLVVTAAQMQAIESELFAQGMPVAALMEKAAGLISEYIKQHYFLTKYPRISVLVGPGHNGGDALVVARELHLQGYQIQIYQPIEKLKELTENHRLYAQYLEIIFVKDWAQFLDCDLIIDGLFGFGLTRSLTGSIADLINRINESQKPVVSIDLPSGLHTDTGSVLGAAIKATESLCLGLWKKAYLQEQAIPFFGKATRLNFGIPLKTVRSQLNKKDLVQQVTPALARLSLPLDRPILTHKYKQGHLLLIGGSRRYAGSILLAALGARATGVGMLSIAAPKSLRDVLIAQLPEALIIACPETSTGAIQSLPEELDLTKYQAIAFGCGLTVEGATILSSLLAVNCPLIIDADGLNYLAQQGLQSLKGRSSLTILTPHLGEFKRLFPSLENPQQDLITAAQQAAQWSQAIVLLKGARSAIATPTGQTWVIGDSSPALARGGSGDVLTGIMGGLFAQGILRSPGETAATAAWWHAQAGKFAAQSQTVLGVDGLTLARSLNPLLHQIFSP